MRLPDPGDTPDDNDAPSGVSGPMPLRWAAVLAEAVGAFALIALMALTVSDALLRTFANRPILGAGDLVQVFLVVVVASAVPLCIAAGRAIAIEIFVNLLPTGARIALHRVTALLSASVLAYLAWRCHVNAGEAAMFGETTMLLRIPFGPYYTVLAISFAFSALLFVLEAIRGRPAA